MYLTEPRITVAQLDVQLRDGNCRRLLSMYYTYSSVSVREDDGLTFGMVLDVAERVRRSAPADFRGRGEARVAIWFVTEFTKVAEYA